MKKELLYLFIFILVLGCKKPDDDPPISVETDLPESVDSLQNVKGIFVLNEGTWQQNNASLSYLDFETKLVTKDYFTATTGRQLGDVGNDLLLVNHTLFVLVNGSNTLEKVNTKTGESKQLKLVNFQQVGRQPRQFVLDDKGDLFITSFDDVVTIVDTASLTVKKTLRVGRDPEGLAVVNNTLFVANSGGLEFPNYDSTVTVIDLTNLNTSEKINVGLNPGAVQVDKYGKLYVRCSGNYDKVKPSVHIIDAATRSREAIWNIKTSGMKVVGDSIFTINSETREVDVYDTKTRSLLRSGIIDVSDFATVSAFHIEPKLQLIFLADGFDYVSRGVVYAYDFQGKLRLHFDAGVIPAHVAVVY